LLETLLRLTLLAPEGRRLFVSPRVERCQRRRRWSLWLASVGIDNGPRVIHGVRVGAAR
jgi:hypothetical protein